jgi:dissimilatory sulfite reductase (desulfoviridin) alpha/beta subunit
MEEIKVKVIVESFNSHAQERELEKFINKVGWEKILSVTESSLHEPKWDDSYTSYTIIYKKIKE